MTTLENAREFMRIKRLWIGETIEDLDDTPYFIERMLQDHSKHVLTQLIQFLEANEKKTVRSIIDELKGKV